MMIECRQEDGGRRREREGERTPVASSLGRNRETESEFERERERASLRDELMCDSWTRTKRRLETAEDERILFGSGRNSGFEEREKSTELSIEPGKYGSRTRHLATAFGLNDRGARLQVKKESAVCAESKEQSMEREGERERESVGGWALGQADLLDLAD
jgi:hypothetical protein